MARKKDFQSAFDIIGPVMMGPSSSHTAGAVKIGNAGRTVLQGEPENIEIHYYESFAKTHLGHGTDVAIIGGLLGYSTFDERIKNSVEIAKDEGIKIKFIEESGKSLGEHPNCALIKADSGDRHIEVNGISIGGGTIKIKSINVNGQCILMNHGLPILEVDGPTDNATINHLINDLIENGADINEEIKTINQEGCLIAMHLNKALSEDVLDKMREKYSDLNFAYIK
ncbi:putative L-serine dehydratase beta chain [Staphylococcus piscifermentans]|uniref:L-serine deaminase n=1 Tax=Staphylococcus piscifermentans TaxID=70258 RepID=A0A239TPT9_9STAP|nr:MULTISPECIES: L-serine ammonia-lyase, iron-sulfur-dependent subunit beta [Staphylococcus]AYU56092.1 L-serine ammonia-lyase, iron-sulfur-dependent, subunit beta [Staphylococcus debuckii]RTX86129.1 L-serine ammonia-lyase, iron-sulfur-dependent, subunit beta [Staphylococcus piscifermentans]GEP84810.1 L-serine dehydratase, iron-sulfur-dependent subunit beta [Staphylococcus piscifermentans]SNU98814.1 putative L-serine dehydratase beta chain [Staphylococcus piscifermentans]